MCLAMAVKNPDIVETHGTYSGHEFIVTKGTGIGFRCGYIKIEPDHPWHGKGYDDVEAKNGDWIKVHGGLTFAEADVVCEAEGNDNGWWLGFDCGHAGDGCDPSIMEKDVFRMTDFGGEFKTNEFVKAECRSLIDQAIEVVA